MSRPTVTHMPSGRVHEGWGGSGMLWDPEAWKESQEEFPSAEEKPLT